MDELLGILLQNPDTDFLGLLGGDFAFQESMAVAGDEEAFAEFEV